MSRNASGFAIVAIVGLLVVLGALGAALSVTSTTHHVGAALDLQGVRAYYAARAGLEWGAYHVLRTGALGCAGVDGREVQFTGNLSDFRAFLACSWSTHDDEGASVQIATVQATACNDTTGCTPASPRAGFATRQLRITLAR